MHLTVTNAKLYFFNTHKIAQIVECENAREKQNATKKFPLSYIRFSYGYGWGYGMV